MAKIESGASADQLTVDPTSKAARNSLYDSAGNLVTYAPTGAYVLPINIRQTAATAAAATVWAMRYVTGALVVKLKKIRLSIGFDGTAAAGTSLGYQLMRFSAATPTAGTAITVIKKRTAYAGSVVTDARFLDTGLTVAGVVFETAFDINKIPASVTGVTQTMFIDFVEPANRFGEFDLASGEGLAIQLERTAIVGQTLDGYVEWVEV